MIFANFIDRIHSSTPFTMTLMCHPERSDALSEAEVSRDAGRKVIRKNRGLVLSEVEECMLMDADK